MARIERAFEKLFVMLSPCRKMEKHDDITAYDKSELEAFQREAKERWGTTEAYQAFEKSTD